ncbi:Glycine receptor subunit beta-type 4 [Aphelenchoides bicaudatus]|nr:Glycine receptor subunit beta-type 4 [Aphelenchoides bicaudatus]
MFLHSIAQHFSQSSSHQAPKHRKEFKRENPTSQDVHNRLRDFANHFANSNKESNHLLRSKKSKKHQNPFYETVFDPKYEAHDLCEFWNTGKQSSDLTWSEPADKLFNLIRRDGEHQYYNLFMAPGQFEGTTTNVSVALYIESMSSVKAQSMDFEVDCYLAMGWYDRRLAHNCTHPILIAQKYLAEELWNPEYYPLDKQECPLVIQSYAYIENLLNLSWHVDPPFYPIASNENLKLNDMVISNMKFERCSNAYTMFRGTGNWSCIRALIVMKRLMLYHIVQTYIPSAMLVSISWMTFFLPPRASPARISLTITSLLTLTTMSNGARQDLPQVSYISALDIWTFVSQALIFLVLLEYSFVSYFMTRGSINCKHRQASISSKIINGNLAAEDLRIRLLNANNNNVHEGRKARAESMSSLNLRHRPPLHPSAERTSSIGGSNAQKGSYPNYTVGSGVEKCVNSAAELYATQCNVSMDDLAELARPCAICMMENEQMAKRIDSYSCIVFPSFFFTFCLIYWLYYNYATADF